MKKMRISNRGFEKSLNSFVSKRILGKGIFPSTEVRMNRFSMPACFRQIHCFGSTELYPMSVFFDNDNIWKATRKLINAYKSKPFWNKSGFVIQPYNDDMSLISRFYLTYTFVDDFLYFKFFARFKNGHRNKRIKQMKIKLN